MESYILNMIKPSDPDLLLNNKDDQLYIYETEFRNGLRKYFNYGEVVKSKNSSEPPPYGTVFGNTYNFELDFHSSYYMNLMNKYYWVIYFIIPFYLFGIFTLQRYMENRPKFNLRWLLVLWNLALAIFSVLGSIRGYQEMMHAYQSGGFKFSVCFGGDRLVENQIVAFGMFAFTFSKVIELGDTLFIVLMKKPLIFLHWYHHASVLTYGWHCLMEVTSTCRWFVTLNCMVHSAMYTYFTLQTLRIKVPRWIAMCITVAQTSQMVVGITINIWAYRLKEAGYPCDVSYQNIHGSFLMYASYFILFSLFFRKAYFNGKSKKLE